MSSPLILLFVVAVAAVASVRFYLQLGRPSSTLPSLRGYIPWLGCAFQWLYNPRRFLQRARVACGPTYTFPMAGKRFLVLTTPDAILQFIRDRRSFGQVEHRGLGIITGVKDPARISRLADVFEHDLASRIIRYFMPDGELEQRITARLFTSMNELATEPTANLLDLVGSVFYDTLCGEVFGPFFPVSDYATFKAFDEALPAALNRIPWSERSFRPAYTNFAGVFYTLLRTAWREGPADGTGFLDGASDFMSDAIRVLKDEGLSEEEVVGFLVAFVWGAHSNLILTAYWTIVNIISDPAVKERILDEIRTHGVLAAKHSSLLQSAVQETMRLTTTPSTVREALVDLRITDIPICKGDIVIADVRTMHFDPTVYESPDTFIVDRFVPESPHRRGPLVVWGGGTTLCKGRHLALFAVKTLIVGLLERYDVGVLTGSTMSEIHSHETVVLRPLRSASISLRRREEARF